MLQQETDAIRRRRHIVRRLSKPDLPDGAELDCREDNVPVHERLWFFDLQLWVSLYGTSDHSIVPVYRSVVRLRGPEGQATQCGLLICNACEFLATDGIAGIAYADPSFGYPSNAILGAGLNTELTDCVFNGLCDYSFCGVPSSVPASAFQLLDGL